MLKSLEKFTEEMKIYALRRGKKVLNTYQNGNFFVGICSDGTRIKETIDSEATKFLPEFALNADVKITNYCSAGCAFCHEGSNINGKHADLNLPIFDSWKPGTEMAIGGGNVLDHPDLIPFLEKLKNQNVIRNITVNQKAVFSQYNLLKKLIEEELVNGVGISITDPSNEKEMSVVNSISKLTENIVFHVIAGIIDISFINVLRGRKVLFLGYKDNVGRGVLYCKEHKDVIDRNIEWLAKNLKKMSNWCSVMSFDNLALAQLNVKENLNLSEEEWKLRFQGKDYGDPNGEDAPSTFYFDAVTKKIARSSTQPYNERIDYTGQTFEEAFQVSLSNYKVNEGEYGELNYKD